MGALLIRLAVASSVLVPGAAVGQSPQADKLTAKAFESASSFAQSLTQWGFIIIGGSLLILVGTSYYRPKHILARCTYLLFIPGWIWLARSLYSGVRAQESYLAYVLLPKPTAQEISLTMNQDIRSQIALMQWGLGCFGLWLVIYLLYWVFCEKIEHEKPQ